MYLMYIICFQQVNRKSGVRLVLEDDSTVIDSEEYFSELPPQTVFVLLQANETWQPSNVDLFQLVLLPKLCHLGTTICFCCQMVQSTLKYLFYFICICAQLLVSK